MTGAYPAFPGSSSLSTITSSSSVTETERESLFQCLPQFPSPLYSQFFHIHTVISSTFKPSLFVILMIFKAWKMFVIVKYIFPVIVSLHLSLLTTLAQESSFTSVFLLLSLSLCDKWCLLLSCLWSPLQSYSFPSCFDPVWILSVILSFILACVYFFLFSFPKMLLCLSPGFDDFNLSLHSDMASVAKAMASPESGLEVRDRMWLKITIPNAFLGKTKEWRPGKKKKKRVHYFHELLCLRGLYRAGIMFSELKPCDLW